MIRNFTGRLLLASCVFGLGSLTLTPSQAATFLASDVTTWLGTAPGPGINESFLVINWSDGSPGWTWGYRWDASVPQTGADLLGALKMADPRFTLTGLGIGFVANLAWNADLTGAPERFNPDYDPGSGAYWNYFVNNDQQAGVYSDGAAPGGAHVLPPLGSPYDEAGPGRWVSSNTGVLGRPLANGSWDGLIYADLSSTGLGLPINAPVPIPEPATSAMAVLLGAFFLTKRNRPS